MFTCSCNQCNVKRRPQTLHIFSIYVGEKKGESHHQQHGKEEMHVAEGKAIKER